MKNISQVISFNSKKTSIATTTQVKLTDFIKTLIRSGRRHVKELESRVMDFVIDVLFNVACSPDCYRGSFYS